MKYRSCDNCQWQDTPQCCGSKICDSFSPLIEELDDDEAVQLVELARTEYTKAYRSYIDGTDYNFKTIKTQICAF